MIKKPINSVDLFTVRVTQRLGRGKKISAGLRLTVHMPREFASPPDAISPSPAAFRHGPNMRRRNPKDADSEDTDSEEEDEDEEEDEKIELPPPYREQRLAPTH